jgi:hypothetical protein
MLKISPNAWYGVNGAYAGRGPFRSPQNYLKEAVRQEDYKWISKGPDPTSIRAAAVFPIDVEQWSHLLDTPWGMNVRFTKSCHDGKYTYHYRMLIVSVQDRHAWLERAIEAGATAWWLGSASANVWTWSPPDLDEHGLEIRPLGTTRKGDEGNLVKFQTKEYCLDDVISDIRLANSTYQEIGDKHGISRITVMKLAKRAGISRKETR